MFTCALTADSELRFLEESDAAELYALIDANRAHLRQWLPFVDATQSADDSLAFIRMTRKQWAENQGTSYGIFHQGLMTATVRLLVDNAFHTWKLNRVEIRVAAGNFKSQAIPERLGFVKEGILRQHEWLYDHFVDHISYSMLASEWK